MARKYTGTLPNLKVDGKVVHAKIGQATSDERGRTTGGKVGDQTGKEVSVSKYSYSPKSGKYNHWTMVARAKDASKREPMAEKMKEICNYSGVGYNQKPKGGRKALYNKLKSAKFVVKNIGKVDTSCTPVVQAVIGSVGIKIAQGSDASHLKARIKSTGKFSIMTDKKYVSSDKLLKKGDILNSGKHTAMVVAERKATKVVKALKKGDKRKVEIKNLQKFLNWYFGKKVLSVDGKFGKNTKKYVVKFQREEKLKADGKIGSASLAKAKAYLD